MRAWASIAIMAMALPVWAAELDGAKITVSGAAAAIPAPVRVDLNGETTDRRVRVKPSGGGDSLPATIHDGQLIFLATQPGEYVVDVTRGKAKSSVSIKENKKNGSLEVRYGRKLFTAFYPHLEDGKPTLWPIVGEGGVHLTRDYPMGEKDKTGDHPHHKSMWTGYGHVNHADYWEYGERTGKQIVNDISYGSGEALAFITADLTWIDTEGKPMIDERREYVFYEGDEGARFFDYNVKLKAAHGAVHFKDTKEGGLVSLRMADGLREKGGTGTITNAAGGVGAGQTWGKPAAWCDYSGPIENFGTRGITIFDHPTNFRHPSHWHVRDYGLMGANAFGYSHFYKGEKNGDHHLEAGADFPFHYRVYIHSGDVNEGKVAQVYAAYAEPLKAEWVK